MENFFKSLLLILALGVLKTSAIAQAPDWKWANSAGGLGYDGGSALLMKAGLTLPSW